MGLFGRSRRSFKIAPGLRMNLSRSGVSYTVGPRGASVNVGGSRGRGGGGGSPSAGTQGAAGCAGIGCFGLAGFGLLLMVGFCSSADSDPPRYTPSPSIPAYPAATVPLQVDTETFYVHGPLNVRTGPGKEHPLVRKLSRGDLVRLGPSDASGWAELRTYGGAREGYVYRESDVVRRSPPSASDPAPETSSTSGRGRRSSAANREYQTGPKGGCYYTYGDNSRKRYVDRSYCN